MQVVCDQDHITECDPENVPYECPVCGSRRLTFIVGELKKDKSRGLFGRKGGVTAVGFKRTDRMEVLDQQYGNKF